MNAATTPQKKSLVIVSGLAGSGKTIAVHALEDLGYYCIDNLPAVLLTHFTDPLVFTQIQADHIALALDSRDSKTPKALQDIYEDLQADYNVRILYLTASVDVLERRFRENRRQHPLALKKGEVSLRKAIQLDEKTLQPIKNLAQTSVHTLLDTSELSAQSLKKFVYHHFAPSPSSTHIFLNLMSFGFKHGMPSDADSVFDVRCFKNPHYEATLKHLTGLEPTVRGYVFSDVHVPVFVEKVSQLVQFLYPLYREEGKRCFSLAIGCTGGKHRSVAIVEELAKIFRGLYPFVNVDHRHLDRD